MKTAISDWVAEYQEVSNDLKIALDHCSKSKEYLQGDVVLKSGHYASNLIFVVKGLIKSHYTHNSKEINSWFYFENSICTSWYSFIQEELSFESLTALEDTTILYLSKSHVQDLSKKFPEFNYFLNHLYSNQLAFLDYNYKGYSAWSAKEKYQNLLLQMPDIELRVKLGDIANLIGVTQETLSRIRAGKI